MFGLSNAICNSLARIKELEEMNFRLTYLLYAAIVASLLLSGCGGGAAVVEEEAAEEEAVEEEAAEEEAVEEEAAEEEAAEEEAVEEEAAAGACLTDEELDAKIAEYAGGYERPTWVDEVPEETVRIAFLSYQNNPFWIQQKVGVERAQAEQDEHNLEADWIVVAEDLDPTLMVAAIESAIVQEYDAISMFALNESVVPAQQKAVDAGIPVGLYATDVPDSPRMVVIGQDLYNAGKVAGYLMIRETGGQGKVGIITGQFGVTPHELRQAGFEEALAECPEMEVVGVVEAHDSADESYDHAQNFMAANPDLKGLYLTAGGPFGAGRAVEEAGKIGEVTVIGFDVTEQHMPYVRSGAMITMHQHEPWQSYDNIVFLYNYLVAGQEPPCEVCFVPAEIVDQNNVDEWDEWNTGG
jgi:ABC-type sugar transport system substrate-binding protein